MAMGIFEMFDLAGNDIDWRQRVELGLTNPRNRDPSKRYSSLVDKICEKGNFLSIYGCSVTLNLMQHRIFWSENFAWLV